MLIIGVNGSPNPDGNTCFLLKHLLAKAEALGATTRLLHAGELVATTRNQFCVVCSMPCNGSCYRGTAVEEAFGWFKKADGVVLGSPVYFGTVSAQLKALFDLSRSVRAQQTLYNRVGAGVTVGTSRFGGQETTMKALHDIMLVQGMLLIGDGYADDDCGHHGVCAVRPANADSFAMQRAEITAKRLVEVCEATAGLRAEP